MNIEKMNSVQVLKGAIDNLMKDNSPDWKQELKKHKNTFIKNFWFDFVDSSVMSYTDCNGHSNTLIDLFLLVKNGQSIRDILSEEDAISEYWFDKPYNVLKKRFDEKVENYLGSFLEVVIEEKKKENQTFDTTRMFDFMIKNIFLSENKCHKCGVQINLLGENNKCEMNIPVIQETYIQVPSGNLLVGDWFREEKNILNELTEVKNTVIGKKLIEINSYDAQYGDSYLAEYAQVLSAAEMNLATVFVGNSSPEIYQNGNNILGFDADSYENEKIYNQSMNKEMPNWEGKGSICTDLWRASVIDEEILVKHLSTEYSQEEAQKMVDEIKSEWTIIDLKVKPGKYKLTYTIQRGYIEKNNLGGINFKLELCEE